MQNDTVRQQPTTQGQIADQLVDRVVVQSSESTPSAAPVATNKPAQAPIPVAVDQAPKTQGKHKTKKEDHETHLPIHSEPRHQSTNPTGIIIVAVIICTCLVAAALYGGMTQTRAG